MYEPQNIKKGKFYYQNLPRIILAILFAVIFVSCGYATALVLIFHPNINTIYPTFIPNIHNQVQCEKSERIWREQKCWDEQHNPLF
ncbi:MULTISPECIES: hypothetical protein [unclassified Tolypothrix]|uniref:hypothetical protein n=1 Tax=unclassified Tolypothrix TaxID=2649714 RepID=UPI0005EAC079|nr:MULTISPECIES: hypothetical protein [unclassified Tolypothrix]BAY94883.1 hypothetical protein NIES3275_69380 [Microchaete diplosiphon NIES-3275]EKF00926.1 hypothetical protein FDUTEX481_08411 [Tolypothrix sp. PCC 7601]MBE9085142.1 hypothetical protein [Tolypothrix sp. LEGE 11397]UYD28527.1 hypothetical protein HGR01_11105 [Tolypothrix sp. PCC 7712]UYD35560.1 hypothetical protein HG267_07270 [Tolypothrix sp. PCC 7601]